MMLGLVICPNDKSVALPLRVRYHPGQCVAADRRKFPSWSRTDVTDVTAASEGRHVTSSFRGGIREKKRDVRAVDVWASSRSHCFPLKLRLRPLRRFLAGASGNYIANLEEGSTGYLGNVRVGSTADSVRLEERSRQLFAGFKRVPRSLARRTRPSTGRATEPTFVVGERGVISTTRRYRLDRTDVRIDREWRDHD